MNLQQLRKKSRSRLFQAISFSLLTAALPMAALAQAPQNSLALLDVSHCSLGTDAERQHCRNQQLSSKLAALHGEQVSGNASASNTAVAGNYTEAAKLGDADSWKTEEFMQDWGLEAMNAHHAYARGLTGNGIRVGIFDSGVGLDHPEFAGRDHQGLKIGELLADGSRCAPDYYLGGAYNPCFGTDGGRAQLDITYWDPDWARLLPPESMHLVDKTELLWVSHGTHVAGTVAANRDGSGMHGVAFGADFSSARLFADTAMWAHPVCVFFRFCEVLTIEPTASAFEDMYQQMNAADIRAMNHSWGLGREPENTEEMQEVFDNPNLAPLWPIIHAGSKSKGMIQVWAAGNSRYNLTPEESPIAGIYASLPRFFNDLEPYWLSVVNVRKGEENESAYVLSEYSMRCGLSKDWCIAAPGTDINSTVLGGQSLEGAVVQGPDGNFHLQGIESLQNATTYEYEDYTGTSMAAPHVTGALALLFERYPYLTNAQVRDVLLTTATDLGAPGVDDVYGWGMVNLKKAIEGYGQFRVDTDVNMVAKAGGTHGWNDARVWDVWTNDISGAAFSFSSVVDGKDIGGWLRLAGNNSFAGLTVNSGTLELTGDNTLGSDVVVNGGVLRNNGTLRNKVILNGGLYAGAGALHGDFHLAQGGSIAPGNSIGTLTINGNYVQEAGTRFFVDMAPPDSTDKLEVTGTATLNGGTVVALRMPGVYGLGQRYNFLTAQGGLSGQFDGVDNSYLGPFLKMVLAYDSHNAYADVVRNATLASAGKTPNQQATGAALDGLVDTNALLQALVLLPSTGDAARAFDQLSGEAHGSVRSVLADDSRHLRNAALSRARTGLDAFTAQGTGAGFSVWADYQSRGGALQGDFNTAYTRYDGHQWLVGGDYQLENGLRIGLFGGSGRLDGNIGHRSSKFEVRNNSLGLHVGGRWSGFGVFAGYTHGKQDIDVKRTVNFAGFSAGLNSDYSAKTRQGFVEVGYLFGGERFQAEPYLQYADVRVKTDGFREMGSSPAALSAVGQSNDLKVTTGGVRASLNLAGSQQDATWLSLRAGVGYRHASGDLSAASVQSFNGSPAFAVLGAPVAKKATVADLGVAARMSERSLLEVGYSGQYADEGNDHGAHARFTFKF